jgi:hypothetical protein
MRTFPLRRCAVRAAQHLHTIHTSDEKQRKPPALLGRSAATGPPEVGCHQDDNAQVEQPIMLCCPHSIRGQVAVAGGGVNWGGPGHRGPLSLAVGGTTLDLATSGVCPIQSVLIAQAAFAAAALHSGTSDCCCRCSCRCQVWVWGWQRWVAQAVAQGGAAGWRRLWQLRIC